MFKHAQDSLQRSPHRACSDTALGPSRRNGQHPASIQLRPFHHLLLCKPDLNRPVDISISKLLRVLSETLLNRIQYPESPRDLHHRTPYQAAGYQDPEEIEGEVVPPEVVGFRPGVLDVVHVESEELRSLSVGHGCLDVSKTYACRVVEDVAVKLAERDEHLHRISCGVGESDEVGCHEGERTPCCLLAVSVAFKI